MKNTDKYSLIILLVLTLGFTVFFYGKVFLSPNSYLFSSHGDGIKNYFTYAAQIKEPSLTESHAMNYPYGENYLYLDCHPVLTVILKGLSKPFPFIEDYSIGIVNFLMIFSIVLSAWFLFLIFRHFAVNMWLAVLSAFSIAVLAPQIFRMTGHLALSYSCFIPLSWYLYIRFYKSENKWKWSILICLNALFWFFIHAYLGMIVVAFTACSFLTDAVLSFKAKFLNMKFWSWFALQVVLPLIFFWSYAKIIDTHDGRTTNPYGYLLYTSNFDSVFLPNHEPLKPVMDKFFSIEQIWEGWAYVGIASVIGIITAIVYFLIRRLKKRSLFLENDVNTNRLICIAVISSIVLLFLAFGYPFKWRLEFLLDKFSIIKNFRGIGRFTWVFYYVITVFIVWFFYSIMRSRQNVGAYRLILFLIPASYFVEGIPYHVESAKSLVQTPNLFKKEQLDPHLKDVLDKIEATHYQAIIPLPYYHIGSENYGKEGTNKSYSMSMLLGYHSGLPLMSNYSTRTSIWEAKNLMQLISPPFYDKNIKKDIIDTRPFLILYTHEELTIWERSLLERSKAVYSNDELSLLEISCSELFSNTSAEWIAAYNLKTDSLIEHNGFKMYTKDTANYIYFDSFESTPQQIQLSGEGSFSDVKRNYSTLKKFRADELKVGNTYMVSFWIYNDGINYGQDVVGSGIFLVVKNEQGKEEWLDYRGINGAMIINGNWSLAEYEFTAPNTTNEFSLMLHGDDNSDVRFYIDDFLIRERGVDLYRIENNSNGESYLFMNNHRIAIKN